MALPHDEHSELVAAAPHAVPPPERLLDCEQVTGYGIVATIFGICAALATVCLHYMWKCERIGPGQCVILSALVLTDLVFAFFLGMLVEKAVRGLPIELMWLVCTGVFGFVLVLLILLSLSWIAFRASPHGGTSSECEASRKCGTPTERGTSATPQSEDTCVGEQATEVEAPATAILDNQDTLQSGIAGAPQIGKPNLLRRFLNERW